MPVLATTDATWVNDAAVSYDAAELRRADAAIFSAGGAASGLTVSVDGSDLVTVTAGRWVIDGNVTVSGTGVYRGGIGAAASVALDARDATYSRIDLVVARQYDPDVVGSHTESKGKVEIITGTPAASPSAPAKPSLAVELARITVPASGGGAASVSTATRESAELIGAGGTGWVSLGTPTNANISNVSTDSPKVRKIGNTVYLYGRIQHTGTNGLPANGSWFELWTLASQYRPPLPRGGGAVSGLGSSSKVGPNLIMRVMETGAVAIANIGADSVNQNTHIYINLSWLVD